MTTQKQSCGTRNATDHALLTGRKTVRRLQHGVVMQRDLIEPGYFDLQALAAYSSCSVRWLRDRLVDRLHPLPHYRIEGKILVKREEFDHWLSCSHVVNSTDGLSEIVDSVVAHMRPSKRSA